MNRIYVEELEKHVRDLEIKIDRLEHAVKVRDQMVYDLQLACSKKDKTIAELSKTVEELKARLMWP